jgi:hypothetical protein
MWRSLIRQCCRIAESVRQGSSFRPIGVPAGNVREMSAQGSYSRVNGLATESFTGAAATAPASWPLPLEQHNSIVHGTT